MLRIAKELDQPIVTQLVEKFFKNTQYGYLPVDHEALNSLAGEFLQGDNRQKICLLWEKEGKVQGIIGGQMVSVPFLNRKAAVECMWWVEPEARGTEAATSLLDAFEYWGKLQGADFMQMMCMPDRVGKALDRWYTRRGYRLTELTYTKEIT